MFERRAIGLVEDLALLGPNLGVPEGTAEDVVPLAETVEALLDDETGGAISLIARWGFRHQAGWLTLGDRAGTGNGNCHYRITDIFYSARAGHVEGNHRADEVLGPILSGAGDVECLPIGSTLEGPVVEPERSTVSASVSMLEALTESDPAAVKARSSAAVMSWRIGDRVVKRVPCRGPTTRVLSTTVDSRRGRMLSSAVIERDSVPVLSMRTSPGPDAETASKPLTSRDSVAGLPDPTI